MPTTPICQESRPSTMTKSFSRLKRAWTAAMASSAMARSMLLALAVAGIEAAGKRFGLGGPAGQEEAQGLFGVFQASGGVEARGELKTGLVAADGRRTLGHRFQRHQAGAPGQGETFESRAGENAIFSRQRNQVGNRAQRSQIQVLTQIIFDSGRFAASRSCLTRAWASLNASPAEQNSGPGGSARRGLTSATAGGGGAETWW